MIVLVYFQACAQVPIKKHSLEIFPGELRWIHAKNVDKDFIFECKGQPIKVHREEKDIKAVVIESYFSKFENFNCQLLVSGKVIEQWDFVVKEKKYPSEKLRVDPKKIKLSLKDQKRVEAEQVMLNKIYSLSSTHLHFKKPFISPLNSPITSLYGIRRVYNNQKNGQHLGVDFRANIGEKVPSTNRGKVVFAGDLFYTGYTVIVDHGLDIFSVYGHLSSTLVRSGDIIDRGDILGLSGNTGRSSGPHLHWGVKVQGQYIDGMALVDETKKYLNE